MRVMTFFTGLTLFATSVFAADMLTWEELPPLPNPDGVAGPFVGVHNDALIVAGGANFPNKPRWETDKVWHAAAYVLERDGDEYTWHEADPLPRATGYGAAVNTPDGVLCMGGNDSESFFSDCYLLGWDRETKKLTRTDYPPLPGPCAFTAAAILGDKVYLAGGMSGSELSTAMSNFWMLDLSKKDDASTFKWEELTPWPGPSRALNLTVTQHDGFNDGIYVIGGRRQGDGGEDDVQFLTDTWEYVPETGEWKQKADSFKPIMAGTAQGSGQSHIFVLGGADGAYWGQADILKDDHPGFPKQAFAYHTITDTWVSAGAIPLNHVTTIATRWGDKMIVASGEIRPRVRSPKIWAIEPAKPERSFGALNYIVLFTYLFAMVGVGVYFAMKNQNTDDYFRGGKQMVWWAAGCSIFATMLSSLTYTGIPSKAFAQDWVYMVGNWMILGVAPIAIYIALPFFRRIDATSAYEYLEKRFNRPVRLFGSASFTLFHIFRMAVVMSLTGYALAAATPLTPMQCVLIMGILSIVYCTIGGVEAVIWTDTIQTFVLLGGAILALGMLIAGADGGFSGFISTGVEHDKFHIFNWDFASDSYMRMAIWVVLLGSFAQNISSYTADQAVVQRYMTTPDAKRAANSIWTNAILSMFATLIFFSLGAALFAFYRANPEKLDPTITTDQIFPLFIANEMPVGLAGLIVAGVFAAAQSTVSTSMNSTATAVVTDFLRPLNVCSNEKGYLRWAQGLTFMFGVLGTLFALVFINPDIKSLFDSFIKVIGLFMGVLGGLFVLGVMTRRANGSGALVGALVGAAVMFSLWRFSAVNGYLYTFTGVSSCVVVGYVASLILPSDKHEIEGLTVYSLIRGDEAPASEG